MMEDAACRARVARLLRWAEAAPFHADRMAAAGLRRVDVVADPLGALASLPPLTKADLRAAGTGALYGGRARRSWRSSRSSGSTGEPFLVYYDLPAWVRLKHFVKLRARAACGLAPSDRVAVSDALPPAQEGRSLIERTGRIRRISALQPSDAIAEKLARFQPDAAYGLPSALLEAGQALRRIGRTAPIARLFTSGELLSQATRQHLTESYGARIYDIYGTSETKEIAWECEEGRLHINHDVMCVEVLDSSGLTLGPSEEGTIVVTLLVNRAMPLIRYRTGDRGTLREGDCPCGRRGPLLGLLGGRELDFLEFDGGRRVSPYMLTCALELVPGLLQYQVRQIDRAHLLVRARVAPGHGFELIAAAARRALARELAGVRIEVVHVQSFPAGPRGKFRVVEGMAASAVR
jgi:phenylacetate-CoA ligase